MTTTARLDRSEEHYDIERVPVNRPVDAAREPWMDGETLVVPLYMEVPIVVAAWSSWRSCGSTRTPNAVR